MTKAAQPKKPLTARMLLETGKLMADAITRGDSTTGHTMAGQYLSAYAAVKAALRRERRTPLPESNNPVLSPRETSIITLTAEGHDTNAIAAQMQIAPSTVKVHLRNARAKARKERLWTRQCPE